eukprot:gene16304-biopygen5252
MGVSFLWLGVARAWRGHVQFPPAPRRAAEAATRSARARRVCCAGWSRRRSFWSASAARRRRRATTPPAFVSSRSCASAGTARGAARRRRRPISAWCTCRSRGAHQIGGKSAVNLRYRRFGASRSTYPPQHKKPKVAAGTITPQSGVIPPWKPGPRPQSKGGYSDLENPQKNPVRFAHRFFLIPKKIPYTGFYSGQRAAGRSSGQNSGQREAGAAAAAGQ